MEVTEVVLNKSNNILIDENNCIRLIDYEYAKRNATESDIVFDLANHFCEWMYNYDSHKWYIPHPLGNRLNDLMCKFLSIYYDPLDIPMDCVKNIEIQTFLVHKKWVQWGIDYYDHTQKEKYLVYAFARAQVDPQVMELFSEETRWEGLELQDFHG